MAISRGASPSQGPQAHDLPVVRVSVASASSRAVSPSPGPPPAPSPGRALEPALAPTIGVASCTSRSISPARSCRLLLVGQRPPRHPVAPGKLGAGRHVVQPPPEDRQCFGDHLVRRGGVGAAAGVALQGLEHLAKGRLVAGAAREVHEAWRVAVRS